MRPCAALVILALSSVPALAQWPTAEMNRTIDSVNFVVNRGCSGKLIDLKNRYILTAEHCVSKQYEIVHRQRFKDDGTVVEDKVRRVLPGQVQQISFKGPSEISTVTYRTKLVLADDKRDLALLQIISDIPNTIAAEIACDDPVRGDAVYIVGNPYAILYSSVVKGIVSSTQRNYPMIGVDDQGDGGLLQVSGGIIGGNSGGGVFNDRGQLIGIAVRASTLHETVGLAAPLSDIKAFLRREGLEAALWGDRCEREKAQAEFKMDDLERMLKEAFPSE